jgi:hypothetical protein
MSATLTITKSGVDFVISWTGGTPPYWLQKTDQFPASWHPYGAPTMAVTKTVSNIGNQGYFRLMDQVPLLATASEELPITLLWLVPELT